MAGGGVGWAGIVIFGWEALPWKPWNKNLNFKIDKDWFRWHAIITYTPTETGGTRAWRIKDSGEDVNLTGAKQLAFYGGKDMENLYCLINRH